MHPASTGSSLGSNTATVSFCGRAPDHAAAARCLKTPRNIPSWSTRNLPLMAASGSSSQSVRTLAVKIGSPVFLVRDQKKIILGSKKIFQENQKENILGIKKNIPNVENIYDFEGAATRYHGFG